MAISASPTCSRARALRGARGPPAAVPSHHTPTVYPEPDASVSESPTALQAPSRSVNDLDESSSTCFTFVVIFLAQIAAILCAIHDRVVLLQFALQYVERVAALIWVCRVAAAQGTPDTFSTHPPRSLHNLCRELRMVLRSLLGEWSVMIAVNASTLVVAVALLPSYLPITLADQVTSVVVILSIVNCLNSLWVTAYFYYVANRALLAANDQITGFLWTSGIAKLATRNMFHPSAVMAVPAASTAWSLAFLLNALLFASPLSPARLLASVFEGPNAAGPSMLPLVVQILLMIYVVLAVAHHVVAAYLFASLGGGSAGDEDRFDHTQIVPISMRSVAQPAWVAAERC